MLSSFFYSITSSFSGNSRAEKNLNGPQMAPKPQVARHACLSQCTDGWRRWLVWTPEMMRSFKLSCFCSSLTQTSPSSDGKRPRGLTATYQPVQTEKKSSEPNTSLLKPPGYRIQRFLIQRDSGRDVSRRPVRRKQVSSRLTLVVAAGGLVATKLFHLLLLLLHL